MSELRGTLDEFEKFAAENEWELAWDAIAAVAERRFAGPECWVPLAEAARVLGMESREAAALAHAERGH